MQLDKFHMDGPDKAKVSLTFSRQEAAHIRELDKADMPWQHDAVVRHLVRVLREVFELAHGVDGQS